MHDEKINRSLKSSGTAKLKEIAKGASVSAKRLTSLLLPIAIVVFSVGSISPIYSKEKAKPALEIKKINKCGTGEQKIRIPGRSGRWYSIIGSSNEKIFTVKIKNNTKKEKRNVRVKFFL